MSSKLVAASVGTQALDVAREVSGRAFQVLDRVHVFEDQARQQVSLKALTRRVDRIETRLELT